MENSKRPHFALPKDDPVVLAFERGLAEWERRPYAPLKDEATIKAFEQGREQWEHPYTKNKSK